MQHGVTVAQCRAAGLPEASFGVDLQGLSASPRAGAYVSGGGPSGSPLWFVVLPAWGQGTAALEPALLSLLPAEDRSVALCNAPLAGSLRPCLVAVAGQHLARVAALAALVVDARACPQGLILIAACGAPVATAPTLDAVLARPELRALCEGFTLGEAPDPLTPETAAPETLGVITLRGPKGTTQHPLRSPRVLLGRSQHADVVLYDARVSRQHCRLERRSEGWVLVVLPGAQGVTVRGSLRAPGEYPIGHGDSFELGESAARLSLHPRRAEASPWQRVAVLEARFASWTLPAPRIPHGVALEETSSGVRPPAGSTATEPRLTLSWRDGEGLEGVRLEWSSRAWSILLEGRGLGDAVAAAHLGRVWRALGAALCDAVAQEAIAAPPAHVSVVARCPAKATWTTPLGETFASPSCLDALLDALAARRALSR